MIPFPIDQISTGFVKLPPGTFSISGTIDVGKVDGLVIEGAGKTTYPQPIPQESQVTRIVQTDPGNPFLAGEISRFRIRNVGLIDGGVHVQSSSTLGSGHGQFENVCFRNSMVEIGTSGINKNAANILFRDCDFRNNLVAVKLNSSQNVGFQFVGNSFFVRNGTLIQVNGGGMVTINGGYVKDTSLLIEVTGAGADTGPENGIFRIMNLDYDFDGSYPVLVYDSHYHGAKNKGRKLVAENIFFNRRNPGTVLVRSERQPPSTEWDVRKHNVFYEAS